MKNNVFESCPKFLGALTWNHPATIIMVLAQSNALIIYIPCLLRGEPSLNNIVKTLQ